MPKWIIYYIKAQQGNFMAIAHTTKTEIIAGFTTFLTMSYIIILNPVILSTPGTGMSFSGVMVATILVSFISTLLMGIIADLPFALAPGMGINAFFTYGLILGAKIPFPEALGLVFWSGMFFVLLSLSPLKTYLLKSIPKSLRAGLTIGIGLFLIFIGLKNGYIIKANKMTITDHAPFSYEMLCAIFGLIIIFFFHQRKFKSCFILGIIGSTTSAALLGLIHPPEDFVSSPDFYSVFMKMDIWGGLKWAYLPSILALILTDLFDSLSTFLGVSQAANMLDKNDEPKNMNKALIVDSIATLISAPFGTSAATTYVESSAGVEVGGRTGLTSIFTAFCFLPFLFFCPILEMIPVYATAPVLIFVGLQMFKGGLPFIQNLPTEDLFPALIIVFMTPFSFSITKGILWGFIFHFFLYWAYGRRNELTLTNYFLTSIAVLNLTGVF